MPWIPFEAAGEVVQRMQRDLPDCVGKEHLDDISRKSRAAHVEPDREYNPLMLSDNMNPHECGAWRHFISLAHSSLPSPCVHEEDKVK